MIYLTVDNSECKAEGLDRFQLSELRNTMFYTTPWKASFFSKGRSSEKRPLITIKGTFPTGLLYLFRKVAEKYQWKYISNDIRRMPQALESFPAPTLGVAPYLEQQLAAEAAGAYGRGIIVAPTGSGKSIIIAMIIAELKVKTLVVVPSLELKKQLKTTLNSIFGKTPWIVVENIDALSDNSTVQYDCVIIDEFHHSGAQTYRKLNKTAWSKTFYKFGLTATPFRSKDEERLLLESVLSSTIYTISYETAVNRGYIVPLEAYSIKLPKLSSKSVSDKWPTVYARHIIDREDRNQKIVDFVKAAGNLSTLILVKQIRHGILLQETLEKQGLKVPFANGQATDSATHINNFSSGQIPHLIASSIVGEGVDTKAAEYVLLAGGVGNSKISIMQNCGRVLRQYKNKCTKQDKGSGTVVIFDDNGHKWLREHNRFFAKVMQEEYDLDIIPLEIIK